jgi:hypothetical protein
MTKRTRHPEEALTEMTINAYTTPFYRVSKITEQIKSSAHPPFGTEITNNKLVLPTSITMRRGLTYRVKEYYCARSECA